VRSRAWGHGRGREDGFLPLTLLHLVEFLERVLFGFLGGEGRDSCQDHEPERDHGRADPIFQIGASECCRENGADDARDGEADLGAKGESGDAQPAGGNISAKNEGQDAFTIE
jgi:hypothetical protein